VCVSPGEAAHSQWQKSDRVAQGTAPVWQAEQKQKAGAWHRGLLAAALGLVAKPPSDSSAAAAAEAAALAALWPSGCAGS